MSLIRSLLLMEAPEELSLPAAPTSTAPAPGSPMSQTDFVPPPQGGGMGGAMGNGGVIPAMPSAGAGGAPTIQKEVINKELILAVTGELKSILNTYEKKFESEDMTPDVGNVYLSSFLEALAYQADKIAALMGGAPAEEAPMEEPLPEPAPMEEPLPEEPPLASEEPNPSPEGEPGSTNNPYSDFTPGEGEAPEGSPFTSPTEAI